MFVTKGDLLPEDLLSVFIGNLPAFKTKFGFISTPLDGVGRYYSIQKNDKDTRRIVTGEYVVTGDGLEAVKMDGKWEIQSGIVEKFFFDRPWPAAPPLLWDRAGFNHEDALDYLTLDDLTLQFRDDIDAESSFEYYHTDDWSPEFYRRQAKLGFIAITNSDPSATELLPQLQKAYAVLDWENLRVDGKVQKLLDGDRLTFEDIRLRINEDPAEVLTELSAHWGSDSWLVGPYCNLMKKLASKEEKEKDTSFRLWGVTLTSEKLHAPIAGELGYTIGKTYTSLSGFFRRDLKEYSNFGKLQMVLLAKELETRGYTFWNLGHPYMEYKTAMGAKIVPRAEFLKRWDKAAAGVYSTAYSAENLAAE